jgi:hypothetical protein
MQAKCKRRLRAKAGAFAYEEGKGRSLRLLLPFVEDAKK